MTADVPMKIHLSSPFRRHANTHVFAHFSKGDMSVFPGRAFCEGFPPKAAWDEGAKSLYRPWPCRGWAWAPYGPGPIWDQIKNIHAQIGFINIHANRYIGGAPDLFLYIVLSVSYLIRIWRKCFKPRLGTGKCPYLFC